jgi:hypothetical protein
MGLEFIMEIREFREAMRSWFASHPEEAQELIQMALRNFPEGSTPAMWASQWARQAWAAAGVDPPRR